MKKNLAVFLFVFLGVLFSVFSISDAFACRPEFTVAGPIISYEEKKLYLYAYGYNFARERAPLVWAFFMEETPTSSGITIPVRLGKITLETASTTFVGEKTSVIPKKVSAWFPDRDLKGCNQVISSRVGILFEDPGHWYRVWYFMGTKELGQTRKYIGYMDAEFVVPDLATVKMVVKPVYGYAPRGVVSVDIGDGVVTAQGTATPTSSGNWELTIGKKDEIFPSYVCSVLREKYGSNSEGDVNAPVSVQGQVGKEKEKLLFSKERMNISACYGQ